MARVRELEVEEDVAGENVGYALHVLPLAQVVHRDRAGVEQNAPLERGRVRDGVLHREERVACGRVSGPRSARFLELHRDPGGVHVVVCDAAGIPYTHAPPLQRHAVDAQEHVLEAREHVQAGNALQDVGMRRHVALLLVHLVRREIGEGHGCFAALVVREQAGQLDAVAGAACLAALPVARAVGEDVDCDPGPVVRTERLLAVERQTRRAVEVRRGRSRPRVALLADRLQVHVARRIVQARLARASVVDFWAAHAVPVRGTRDAVLQYSLRLAVLERQLREVSRDISGGEG